MPTAPLFVIRPELPRQSAVARVMRRYVDARSYSYDPAPYCDDADPVDIADAYTGLADLQVTRRDVRRLDLIAAGVSAETVEQVARHYCRLTI